MSIGNEPAYPVSEEIERGHLTNGYGSTGLTKRELFAAMAMQGMIASGRYGETVVSPVSVAYADALLAELSKEPGHE